MQVAALLLVLHAMVVAIAHVERREWAWFPPRPEVAAPAFSALMVLGLAACAAGTPYVPDATRGSLAALLAVGLAAGAFVSLRFAGAIVGWVLPVLWFTGSVDDMVCFCGHRPRATEFNLLAVALFAGSMALRVAARRTPTVSRVLPDCRVIR